MKLLNKQRGFTLVELVATTVILGVLAAVAIPKFNDLKGDAAQSAVTGIASTLTTAANSNYAKRSASASAGTKTAGADITCATVAPLLLASTMPELYSVTSATPAAAAASAPASALVLGDNPCTLTRTEGGISKSANFGILGIS